MPSIEAELEGNANLDTYIASGAFKEKRDFVRECLRAIVDWVFTKFELPITQGGMDVGSGASGEMVNNLLPGKIDTSKWRQIDIHPGAVEQNKRDHPYAWVEIANYLNLSALEIREQMHIITGLSSLDATSYVDTAIQEIANSLRKGGYFLHIQDVLPGDDSPLYQLNKMGENPPYATQSVLIGKNIVKPILYKLKNGEMIHTSELFRKRIETSIQDHPDMELLFGNWVTAVKPTNNYDNAQIYGTGHLQPLAGKVQKALQMPPHKRATVLVTLARKKNSA